MVRGQHDMWLWGMKTKGYSNPALRGIAAAALFLHCSINVVRGQNVMAWGDNAQGQTDVPVSATNVTDVAAGWFHSLALRSDDSVISWGSITNVPLTVFSAVRIAAGASHNVALRSDGMVVAWGSGFAQTNVPPSATNVIAIAAGDSHTLALRSDGKIVAWGNGSSGQTTIPSQCTNIVAIAAGGELSMALRTDGVCFIWGAGFRFGTRTFRSVLDVVAISAGASQQVALTATGTAIGRSASVPLWITNLVVVACASNYSLGLGANGEASAWGNNSLTNLPSSATNLIAVAAGPSHCLAVRAGSSAPRLLHERPAYQGQAFPQCRLPLHARAVGGRPLTYQWLTNGVAIPDANVPAPNLRATLGNDSVQYQVVVSNDFGAVTSGVSTVSVRPLKFWGADIYAQAKIPVTVNNTFAVAAGAHHCLALSSSGVVSAAKWVSHPFSTILGHFAARSLARPKNVFIRIRPWLNPSRL